MKTAIVLFAGVMTASAALAAMNDRMAEERYRAKYGRNTPPRKHASVLILRTPTRTRSRTVRAMHGAAASSTIMFMVPHTKHASARNTAAAAPREELRQKAEMKDLALHVRKCADLGQCPRVHVETVVATTRPGMPAPTDAGLRLRAKFGRSAPTEAQQTVNEEHVHVASADLTHCEHGCCYHVE